MSVLPTSPQPIGKVLDTAFKLYRASLKPVLPLSALYALLSQLPQVIGSVSSGSNSGQLAPSLGVAVLLAVIVGAVVSVALYAALIDAIHRIARGRHGPLGISVARGFRKVLPVIGAIILVTLAVMGGMILLVIPGIILMITLVLTIPAIIVEDCGVIEAIRRSHRLVWGDWWRTLGELTVIGIIYFIPLFLISAVIGAVAGLTGTMANGGGLSVDLAVIILNTLLAPLLAAGFIAIFYDRRLRKEGSDLEARLSAEG